MTEPYLALYVNDGTLYLAKKLPTEARPRVILDVGIDEIISDEFEEAAKKLGTTALGILSLWHKDVFNDWGQLAEGKSERESAFDLAMDLISRSVSGKTNVHVKSIELFLRQAAIGTDSVQQFLDEAWPPIRARLESYSS